MGENALKVAVVSGCLYSVPPRGRFYLGHDMGWASGYGGESQVHTFVRALCRAGHEVELFASPGSIPPEKGHLHYNPQANWMNAWSRELSIWQMYRDEMLACDVIHDWSLTKYVHHMAMTTEGAKVIMTPWGTGAPPPFYIGNTVLWSEFQRQLFLEQGYPKSTRFVHGAIEPGMWSVSYDEGKYVLYLSRAHPSKGSDVVLKLAREMGFRLYFVCDTESPDHIYYLQEAQKEYGRDRNITFVTDPTMTEKDILYRNASAMILPSFQECFGLVVIEALAHGTPVILRRDGAYPEMIRHGVHGFLCDDYDDYASAIQNISLIDRHDCRKIVEEKFNTDRMVKDYEPIYTEVIGGLRF